MTSSGCIADELGIRCDGTHDHVRLQGWRAAVAAIYLEKLCNAMCRGLVKQKQAGRNNFVASRESDAQSGRKMLVGLNASTFIPKHWRDNRHDDDGGNETLGYRPQDGRSILREQLLDLRISQGEVFQEEALQEGPHRMRPRADKHLQWAPQGNNQSGPFTQALQRGVRLTGRSVFRSVRNCPTRPGMVTC